MIQKKDYLIKLIQVLFQSISKLISDNSLDSLQKKGILDSFYKEFLGIDSESCCDINIEELITLWSKENNEDRLLKMEMLSELMFADCQLQSGSSNRRLLQSTLEVLEYLENYSDTYSIIRLGKIDYVKSELGQLEY